MTRRDMPETRVLEASILAEPSGVAVLLYPRAKIFLEHVQIPSKKISEQYEYLHIQKLVLHGRHTLNFPHSTSIFLTRNGTA